MVVLVLAAALLAAFLLGKSVPAAPQRVEFSAPAVSEDGRGVLVPFSITLRPGTGRVLVDIQNAFYKEDVENSIRKSRVIAAREVGFNPNAFDLEFRIAGAERVVGGESAGALFTAAIAAAFLGRKMRSDAIASAGVKENGELASVEGVEEKILSASEAGVKYFIIAEKQEVRNEGEFSKRVSLVRASHAREVIKAMIE